MMKLVHATLRTWETDEGRSLLRETGDHKFYVAVADVDETHLRLLREAIDEALQPPTEGREP